MNSQAAEGLAALVRRHVQDNEPFGAELANRFDEAGGLKLYQSFRGCGVRDVLLHDTPAMRQHCRRARALGAGRRLEITRLLRTKLRSGRTRPSTYALLTALRLQWHRLLTELPGSCTRRLDHVLQVQLTPPLVRDLMTKFTAVTFGSGAPSLPGGTVPLDNVRAQWLNFYRKAPEQAFVSVCLRESAVRVDPDSHEVVLRPDEEYDFSYLPGNSGGPERRLPVERTVTFDSALAAHEAAEMAAVSGANASQEFRVPEVFVGTQSPQDFTSVDCSLGLMAACEERLRDWWAGMYDGGLMGLPAADPNDPRIDPFAWVRFLCQGDVRAKLLFPTASLEGVLAQLGDVMFNNFTAAVFRSLWERKDGLVLVPLAAFNPYGPQRPVHRAKGLFLRFGTEFFGRDCYRGGEFYRDFAAPAVQVLERAEDPLEDPEDATSV